MRHVIFISLFFLTLSSKDIFASNNKLIIEAEPGINIEEILDLKAKINEAIIKYESLGKTARPSIFRVKITNKKDNSARINFSQSTIYLSREITLKKIEGILSFYFSKNATDRFDKNSAEPGPIVSDNYQKEIEEFQFTINSNNIDRETFLRLKNTVNAKLLKILRFGFKLNKKFYHHIRFIHSPFPNLRIGYDFFGKLTIPTTATDEQIENGLLLMFNLTSQVIVPPYGRIIFNIYKNTNFKEIQLFKSKLIDTLEQFAKNGFTQKQNYIEIYFGSNPQGTDQKEQLGSYHAVYIDRNLSEKNYEGQLSGFFMLTSH